MQQIEPYIKAIEIPSQLTEDHKNSDNFNVYHDKLSEEGRSFYH